MPSGRGGRRTRTTTTSIMITAVRVTGTGRIGSRRTRTAAVGTTALTMRSALSRMAIHQVPRTKIVIGTVTVKEAATSLSLLWLVRTSISTSMPADRAPAAAKTK